LLRHELPNIEYITFDFVTIAEEAEDNPTTFLGNISPPVILDEIQYAPSLFRELKIRVDENRDTYGQWILTGSQKFSLMQGISESLAGRIGILYLETLSAKELRDCRLFKNDQITNVLWQGGFPELWANEKLIPREFFPAYIQSYLERDLQSIISVRSRRDFQRFMRMCAARAGKLLNYKDLAAGIGVASNTIKSWVNALEATGIISLLPPYFANVGKRMTKTPKLYFSDQGLLCSLLNINSLTDLMNHPGRGELWENFVYNEYVKTLQLLPGQNIFFYRDQNGVEIDFIVELGGTLHLIEAKAAERVDERKLNFSKVAKLLPKTTCTLACMVDESRKIHLQNYTIVNPLICDV